MYNNFEPEKPIPDGQMTPEQMAIAASLNHGQIEKIDAELLSHARSNFRKVAMIVGATMINTNVAVPGLPDIYYAQRIKYLVQQGLLVAEGNLDYMRFSEIRLP